MLANLDQSVLLYIRTLKIARIFSTKNAEYGNYIKDNIHLTEFFDIESQSLVQKLLNSKSLTDAENVLTLKMLYEKKYTWTKFSNELVSHFPKLSESLTQFDLLVLLEHAYNMARHDSTLTTPFKIAPNMKNTYQTTKHKNNRIIDFINIKRQNTTIRANEHDICQKLKENFHLVNIYRDNMNKACTIMDASDKLNIKIKNLITSNIDNTLNDITST